MINKRTFLFAILAVVAVAFIAGCTGAENVVKSGDNVSMDYIVWLGDNTTYNSTNIYDTSYKSVAEQTGIYYQDGRYEPMYYVIGSNVIMGMDDQVLGMKVGESKNFTLDQPFGIYNQSLIMGVPMSMFNGTGIVPYVNETITYDFNYARIDHIVNDSADSGNGTVYLNFNGPLAGKTVNFMVTVKSITSGNSS